MACRDRTSVFIKYRDSFRGTARADIADAYVEDSKVGRRIAKQKLLDGNGDIEMGVRREAPPWVRTVESTMTLFEMIRTKKDDMARHMGKSKRIGFDEESEKRRRAEISLLADEVSDLFRRCEKNIQGVNEGIDRSNPQDCAMRKNVQSSLATTLHEVSVSFRKDQKKYLEKLRDNEAKSRYKPTLNHTEEEFEDTGFSQAQMADLEEVEQSTQDREHEIVKVSEAIRDLQTIFKELAVLIIDQGSIIDRIDYNMEKTAEQTAAGKEELTKAERSHRRSPAMCCILILSVALGLMSLLLVMKILGYISI